MSLFAKGITRLSQLEIDADKNWEEKGIVNLREIAAGMTIGDLAVRGGAIISRIAAGAVDYVLTSAGPGHIPYWAPAPGILETWIGVWIYISKSESIAIIDYNHAETLPQLDTEHVEAYIDAPGDNIIRLDRQPDIVKNTVIIPGYDYSIPITPTPIIAGFSILCDGFVEETAATVQTDKTAEARSSAAHDLNLNPMTPQVNDKIYVGSEYRFWQVQVNQGVQGIGNWLNHWYYWNGVAWVAVIDEMDGSNEWQDGTGLKLISHTPQLDWDRCAIQGMDLFWLMSQTDGLVNQTTAPLGSQVWVALVT